MKNKIPFPYWVGHAIITAVLFALIGGIHSLDAALWSWLYYAGREFADFEGEKGEKRVSEGKTRFDYSGFFSSLITAVLLFIVFNYLI